MDHLWSPWRLQYVTTGGSVPPGCVFCTADAGADAAQDALVVHRGTTCFVILNLFPYNNGHLMVVPGRHIATLGDATPEELHELMQLTQRAERVLRHAYQPHGLNVGINIGKAAGAGVADHLHIHVVPRWNGDTNFMTTVGESRVLPETLDATAARLRPLFDPAGVF
ncbi:MAG: HIT domain-containing protein [Acidobacteria bacterium]|nr:HIT domain-containing protein [Acidobacteriota bacterium]